MKARNSPTRPSTTTRTTATDSNPHPFYPEQKRDRDHTRSLFCLSLSEPRIALAKKGSFTQLDLKDVDVDGAQFSYDATRKQISFTKTLWLTQGLQYEMRLSGTYKVLEMTRTALVLQKESGGTRTRYTFRRYK